MAVLFVLVLSAGVALCSASVHVPYDQLQDTYKKGVDLALQQLHSHSTIQHHFRFLRSLLRSDIESGFEVAYIYHNFYLKATKCPKGTEDPTQCQFRNDRPLIDCAVCYKTFEGEIEPDPKPYINCVHKPALTEDMKTARVNHCNEMGYSSGAPTLLASVGSK